jgi:hypothetical protein
MARSITGVLGTVGMLLLGCDGRTPAPPAASPPSDAGLFLRVEQIASHPQIAEPMGDIPETAWVPDSSAPGYRVEISSDGKAVEISPAASADGGLGVMQGHLDDATPPGARTRRFQLDAGTFAGGRFVIDDGPPRRAEIVIYGSGVPIIRAERGPLVGN